MAQAETTKVLNVSKEKFFATITDYDAYPEFVDGCKSVKVKKNGPNDARVTYNVSMMKEISYTLDHKADPDAGRVEWKLVESDFLKTNRGAWEIKSLGPNKIEVTYSIEIDFKFPVPGLILNRLVKSSLPSMIDGFAERAGA